MKYSEHLSQKELDILDKLSQAKDPNKIYWLSALDDHKCICNICGEIFPDNKAFAGNFDPELTHLRREHGRKHLALGSFL